PVESGLPAPKQIDQEKRNTNVGGTLYVDPNADTSMKFGFALGDLEDNTYADKRRNSHSSTNNQSALIFAEMQQKQD
ncbi:hypothetical protein VXE61_22690, partial [Acinetobacter nosocomialis]